MYTYKGFTSGATFKDADSKKGIVSGYFSRFDNVDSDGDIIRRGAFTKTINENGPDSPNPRVKHLMNHNPSQPLGSLITLKEDATGLYYESQVGSHNLGQDFIKMVESNLITEHSIGFRTIKKSQLKQDGQDVYEIKEVKLFEGSSLTAWGANPLTPITGLKSITDLDKIIEQQKAIEDFCRKTTATDETIQMLILHSKQLSQLILDIKHSSRETLEPEEDLAEVIQSFTKSFKL